MFEYHCWAVVQANSLDEESVVLQELRDRIAAVQDEAVRESFLVTTLNEVHVIATGLRNHYQGEAPQVFEWLAGRCPGAYGLMYLRGEQPDPDGKWRFEVRRISRGAIEYLEDRYFGDRA